MHRCLIPLACEYQATCMCGWQLTYWICSKLTFGYSWVMLFKIEYTCFAYYHDKMVTSVFKKMRWSEYVSIISCRWMSESYNVRVFVSYIFLFTHLISVLPLSLSSHRMYIKQEFLDLFPCWTFIYIWSYGYSCGILILNFFFFLNNKCLCVCV